MDIDPYAREFTGRGRLGRRYRFCSGARTGNSEDSEQKRKTHPDSNSHESRHNPDTATKTIATGPPILIDIRPPPPQP